MDGNYNRKWCTILPGLDQEEPRVLDRSLFTLLMSATEVIGDVADNMYTDHYQWQRTMMGHTFNIAPQTCPPTASGSCVVHVVRNWLRSHEDAQIMIASILVVVGLWWIVRAILSLFINLICPLMVVVLAVVCVPQLRGPLFGQNYPQLANLLRSILLKMADNIQA